MSTSMQSDVYENLIKQIVYIEENIDGISCEAAAAGFFPTKSSADEFFSEYIGKVESLFKDLKIVEKEALSHDKKLNALPFIVLGSSFTLTDSNRGKHYYRLSREVIRDSKSPVSDIYFLSDAGMGLLLKKTGEHVQTDLGKGLLRYKVGSITIR